MIETIADAQKYAFRSKVQTGASFMVKASIYNRDCRLITLL